MVIVYGFSVYRVVCMV